MSRKILSALLLITLVSAPARAVVWGIKSINDNTTGSTAPANLFRFDETAPANVTDLGAIQSAAGQSIDADGLAINVTGTLFAFQLDHTAGTSSTLVTINPTTAQATTVGSALTRNIRGATFDAAGNLWALDAGMDQLLRINPITGDVVDGSVIDINNNNVSFDVATGSDIAFASDGSMILVNNATLYNLDPTIGAIDDIITFLSSAYAGLAPGTEPDTLNTLFGYEINDAEDLDTFDADAGYARSAYVAGIPVGGFNAGRGDLASFIPEPAGCIVLLAGLALLHPRRRRA